MGATFFDDVSKIANVKGNNNMLSDGLNNGVAQLTYFFLHVSRLGHRFFNFYFNNPKSDKEWGMKILPLKIVQKNNEFLIEFSFIGML